MAFWTEGKVLFKKQVFTGSLIQKQINNKTIIESVVLGYEKLLRPRVVLSVSAFVFAGNTNLCLNNSSYPTRPHSIIV